MVKDMKKIYYQIFHLVLHRKHKKTAEPEKLDGINML